MVAGWLAGWLAASSLCGVFCLLMMSDGVTVSWLFLWSEREREIVKASRQHSKTTPTVLVRLALVLQYIPML